MNHVPVTFPPALTTPRARNILAIGNRPETLAGIGSVLRNAGYQVTTATVQQTLRLLDEQRFDAIVLCHTVNSTHASSVQALVQSSCGDLPVLRIYYQRPEPGFRFVVPSFNGDNLVSVLSLALRRECRASA